MTSVLTIDLHAVVANYRSLKLHAAQAECGAVVKSNGYGLGLAHVAQALLTAGCRTFFITNIEEGIALRQALAELFGGSAAASARLEAAGVEPTVRGEQLTVSDFLAIARAVASPHA